ncbi:MAG: MFS transporter [Candidatus Marinimicrobia bacterium]|nr:MFS transporter [Candidatus Neomarinimicrobiota bacterium]
MDKHQEKKGFSQVIMESFKELKETMIAFIKAPRALWGINIPYVLEGLAYFGILTILGKFCSENIQMSDVQAGWVYSMVTGGITFAMVLLGGYTDKLGIRRSLTLALGAMLVGRVIIAFAGTFPMGSGMLSPMFFLVVAGLLLMVTGYGLYQPAAYAGVKRYTGPKTASMGYAVIYALMNLGAFLSGFLGSFTRNLFKDIVPPNGLPAVFWLYSLITAIAMTLCFVIISKKADIFAFNKANEEKAAAKEKSDAPEEKKEGLKKEEKKIDNIPFMGLLILTVSIFVVFILEKIGKIDFESRQVVFTNITLFFGILGFALTIWEFLRKRPDHPFRDLRFVFFIFVLIPVQTLFAHNWLTIPYYLDRAFQGSFVGNYFEFFSNLNPILIFVLTPIVAGLTAKANVYKMMIIGTMVMALPAFLLTAGPNLVLFLVYILLMSIGEAMWQPRFLQWIAEIAPEGKTGAYMGIGQMPWFLTKVVTGLYSGLLITEYCPIPGPEVVQQTGKMWFIHALIAMVSPVALILAKKWMTSNNKNL